MLIWHQFWCVIAHRPYHRQLSDGVERYVHLDTVLVICERCGSMHRRWARGMRITRTTEDSTL